MPTHQAIPFDRGVFSITFTCIEWRPLIAQLQGYPLVYQWFDVLCQQGHAVVGYVIMPNHLHVMIAFKQTATSINSIIGNGKRFMAYGLVKSMQQMNAEKLMSELAAQVSVAGQLSKHKHAIWEPSFDWKHCSTPAFMKQKLDYYHLNPCRGKWMLANAPVEYRHSSALYYATGQQGEYPVVNYLSLSDMEFGQ
ncbi:MAG: hypothetical protein IT252_08065 [Chitinophagaceae bacterium]|nr:hypothetical protein [Chitinophagaceae bacterium]